MDTHREVCASCGFVNVGLHVCPGGSRPTARVAPQLANLRVEVKRLRARVAQLEEQLADARSLIATMHPDPEAR